MIDNSSYRSNNTGRPGRARPTPRPRRGRWPSPRRPRAGSPTPLSAATPDGPTSARCGAWTPGGGPRPVDDASLAVYLGALFEAGRAPATAASPSPPSGFGPRSPASRPPPGKRPPACWAASVARPPTGAGARPPRCARTGSPRFSPPPPVPHGRPGVESTTTAHRRGRLDAVIASLLFMGGLRRSEVSALEWRDVSDARDGDGVLLTVRTSKRIKRGTPPTCAI